MLYPNAEVTNGSYAHECGERLRYAPGNIVNPLNCCSALLVHVAQSWRALGSLSRGCGTRCAAGLRVLASGLRGGLRLPAFTLYLQHFRLWYFPIWNSKLKTTKSYNCFVLMRPHLFCASRSVKDRHNLPHFSPQPPPIERNPYLQV